MALRLCGRAVIRTCRRTIAFSSVRRESNHEKAAIEEALEHATGLEKITLIAEREGDDDMFDMKAMKRGPGTKDSPNVVHSVFKSRIVGCVCEDDQTHVNWMWLHEGTPKRCECGYWFKLEQYPLF